MSVHEYENVFKMARSTKKSNKMAHRTREVFYNELLDLKRLVKTTVFNRKRDDKGNTVNWLKVKSFRYEKQMPDIIQYKYELKN